MKALKYGFGLALIGGFTLMAACGGSSNSGDDSSGAGESSTSTAGASSSTAGDSSSTAGSSSSTAGDTSSGGDTTGSTAGSPGKGGSSSVAGGPATGTAGKGGGGTTGTGGTTGNGGAAATNPKDCPAALPSGTCMPLANNNERCTYGDQSCRCRGQQGGGMNGTAGTAGTAAAGDMWQCTTVPVCPTTKPTAGDACTDGNEVCQFTGNGACVCNNNAKKWQCFGGGTGTAGAGGTSGGTAGAGGGTGATPCPQMKPAADATCTGNNLCQFGKGVGCICDGTNWVCN